jgi:hypothetical protein
LPCLYYYQQQLHIQKTRHPPPEGSTAALGELVCSGGAYRIKELVRYPQVPQMAQLKGRKSCRRTYVAAAQRSHLTEPQPTLATIDAAKESAASSATTLVGVEAFLGQPGMQKVHSLRLPAGQDTSRDHFMLRIESHRALCKLSAACFACKKQKSALRFRYVAFHG